MEEQRNNNTPGEADPSPGYTPASFEKRTAAWMGIVYMLMLVGLITYSMATARNLPGTAPLLLVPVSVASMVVTVHRKRVGTWRGGPVFFALVLLVCLAALLLGLALGVPALMANLTAPR